MTKPWSIDADGHLDLSGCYLSMGYDWFSVESVARAYYFSEMKELIAWDGRAVTGLIDERRFCHLICKHGRGELPLNPLTDIDIRRVEGLPVMRSAIRGELPVELYRQVRGKKEDVIEVVVNTTDENYVVVLALVEGCYKVRSAYPAGERYVRNKVMRDGEHMGSISH